jgi:OmpA-OmpF porin, OOP family
MSRLSIWHFLLVAWIALGVFLWHRYLCDCWSAKETTHGTLAQTSTWNIKDGNDFSVTSDQHFRFFTSEASYIGDLSPVLQTNIGKTVNYLKAHPDKSILITGFYHQDEKNNSVLPNLGLARANDIKAYLALLGASTHQLSLAAKLLDSKDFFVGDTLQKGVDFTFVKTAEADTRIEDIKKRLKGKPITLYFGTNEKEITLTDQQRADFADLIHYLDNVPTSELDISGHTDNMGKANFNKFISLERAKFVATYLEQNGNINADKIKSAGFGSEKPIVPNTTKENKALNRRVEVTLN